MLAALLGLLFGASIIVLARLVKGERWMYSLSLVVLPLVYAGFALYAGDVGIGAKEMLWGSPWLVAGIGLTFGGIRVSAVFVGALWILHGVYDAIHGYVFVNPGVPAWYPALCAGTDLLVGGYLLWLSTKLVAQDLRTA